MNKPLVKSWGAAIILTLASFALAFQFVKPAPPDHLTLATGSPTGAYHAFGVAMQQLLAENGIKLTLETTAGSTKNAALLAAGKVDIALLQGGTAVAKIPQGKRLRALASLYYEPLWIFHRLDPAPDQLNELNGLRINRGSPGSGTRELADELLALNDVATEDFTEMGITAASNALQAGELDALFIVGGEKAADVNALLHAPGVEIMNLPRAEAYHLQRRYLSPVTLPAGAVDLATNRPPATRHMIAVTAMLVANDELHPALVDLLLQLAPDSVSSDSLFHEAGEFPSGQLVSIPLSKEAERFHKRGPSFLQRFLPFWAATLIDRLIVMLIPLAALVFPLFKLFPPVYRWRVRSRIYRWYEDLRHIEERLDGDADRDEASKSDLRTAIVNLEDEVKHVDTPLSYADELYQLRSHIDLVRRRIER